MDETRRSPVRARTQRLRASAARRRALLDQRLTKARVGYMAAPRAWTSIALMLACLLLIPVGVGVVFGAGWAMIVAGALFGALSLLLGWESP